MAYNAPSATIYDNFVLNKIGQTVSRTPITKTIDNITGRETLTSGTAANITAYVAIADISWSQTEIAKLEGTDGYISVASTATLNEHDLITVNSKTYECIKVVARKDGAGTTIFKDANLLLKS